MERISRFRIHIILLAFLVLLGFFAFKIYDLQIIETGGNMDNSTTYTILTRVKAARGDILDTNGNLLVSNRASYDLALNHYVLLNATGTNDHLYRLVKLCQEEGIEYIENFPITRERPFTYTLKEQNSAQQRYFQAYLAYMGGLDSDISAPLLIQQLRKRYDLPAEWTDEEARAIIGLRYEMALRNCVSSLPQYIFIADVKDQDLSDVVELNVPGIKVEYSTVREYNTEYAAHILGFVGAMNPEQWEYYKNIDGYEMDTEIGQDGLEAAYEEYLHGTDGWREDTVSTDGTLVSSRYLSEPKAGSNVEVSIDINLQIAAEDQLAKVITDLQTQPPYADGTKRDGHDAEGGAVVAMNVKTGQVLVCGSYPTYDLSTFFDDYEELSTDEGKPMYNRALLAAYPPGSTYKMSMVVGGINSGTINSKTTVYDSGRFMKYASSGYTPACHIAQYGYGHGSVNAAQALRDSCNVFFYDLGDKMNIKDMDETAKALGLGEPTGIELYEEIGRRANPENKKKLYDSDHAGWYVADQISTAIGQSDNLFTPMQLCSYVSTLANRGNRYKATFMNRVVSDDYTQKLADTSPSILSHLEICDDAYGAYTQGMYMAAHASGGTAASTFMNYPIKIAAKTGTAETGIIGTSDHGAFVCYAPADDPQIAIAVYVEKGGHGSTLASVAKAILDIYFEVGEIGEVTVHENKLS